MAVAEAVPFGIPVTIRARRLGSAAALASGVAWLLLGSESIIRPDAESYRHALFLIPWVLAMAAIVGLHAYQRDRVGRLGKVGFWFTIVTMAAAGTGVALSVCGVDAVDPFLFPAGPLAWISGMLMLGLGTIRAKALTRRAGLALMLSEPLTMLTGAALSPWVPLEDGSYSGAIANGVAFLILGLAMRDTLKSRTLQAESRGVEPTAQRTDSAESSAFS